MKKIQLTFSPFTKVLLFWGTVVTAAIFLTNSYPVDNLLGFGGVYLAMILIAGLGQNLITAKFNQVFLIVFETSVAALGLLSMLKFLGHPELLANLAKSPLVTVQLLGIAFVGLISTLIISQKTTPKMSKKITLMQWLVTGVIFISLGVNLYSLLPGQQFQPVLPSLAASWSVALDMLRFPQTAALGVGPNNYHLAYARFKPVWINQTPLWNIQFASGANLPLTLLVSTGILGLIGWVWLLILILKQIKYRSALRKSPLTWILLTLLGLQLLLPPTTSLLIIFGLILASWLSLPAHQFDQIKPSITLTRQAAQASGIILFILTGFGFYYLGRATLASINIFMANQVGQNNQITRMYQLQQQAIKLNPYLADYRRRYALTNLSIATALSNKVEPTDQEKNDILELIQQAIREGRAATELQPADVRNWQVLAQIYSNLNGVAAGADQWTVDSYVQAIQASPTDPELRIALGTIFYHASQYNQAEQFFAQAVTLKPDYANAHYNLANALAKQNKLREAVISYENVLSLIEPASENYQLVTAELTTIQTKLGQQ